MKINFSFCYVKMHCCVHILSEDDYGSKFFPTLKIHDIKMLTELRVSAGFPTHNFPWWKQLRHRILCIHT